MRALIVLLALAALTGHAGAQSMAQTASSATKSDADREPLWEIGAGIGGALTPNYPGATGSTGRVLPLPVVIYRGDFLRIGDGSVASGRLFQNDRLEFDISLNGSFDAESDDVDERRGMPDLGFIAEVGPELEVLLSDPADTTHRLKLELPLRAAFSVDDGSLGDRGFVFSPQLEYERPFADGRYEWSLSLTPSFASERLQDYFYEVDPAFATAQRPAYDANGGYLRTSLGFGLQRRGERSFAAFGVSLASLAGGANEDSPLRRRDFEVSVAAVVILRLWESERRAPR